MLTKTIHDLIRNEITSIIAAATVFYIVLGIMLECFKLEGEPELCLIDATQARVQLIPERAP